MQITKGENARLRWLQKAVPEDDERPVLECIHVEGAMTMALDGFRAHFIKTPTGLVDEKLVKLPQRILVKDTEIEVTPQEGHYPDISGLVPAGSPALEVCVNGEFLAEALSGMKGQNHRVFLRFQDAISPIEVLGRAADDTEVYALVMPVTRPAASYSRWRPYHKGE